MDTMEKIFSLLNVSDLARLSQTCHHLHKFIMAFLLHQVTSAGLEAAFKIFMSANKELLTLAEINLFDKLHPKAQNNSDLLWQGIFFNTPPSFNQQYKSIMEKLSSIDRLADLPEESLEKRWMIWWLFVRRRYYEKPVVRVSCCNSELVGFPHRGNDSYIPTIINQDLERRVVNVKTVCWLQINTTFRDLGPGTYVVSLRMKIASSGLKWPHEDNQNTYLTITYPGKEAAGDSMEKVVMNRKWWRTVERNQTPDYSDAEFLLHTHTHQATGKPNIEYDLSRFTEEEKREKEVSGLVQSLNVLRILRNEEPDFPWFTLSLPAARLHRKGDIWFELKDTECGWWKGGLIFDFIQLRKID